MLVIIPLSVFKSGLNVDKLKLVVDIPILVHALVASKVWVSTIKSISMKYALPPTTTQTKSPGNNPSVGVAPCIVTVLLFCVRVTWVVPFANLLIIPTALA